MKDRRLRLQSCSQGRWIWPSKGSGSSFLTLCIYFLFMYVFIYLFISVLLIFVQAVVTLASEEGKKDRLCEYSMDIL